MDRKASRSALANRRLFVQNRRTLICFSPENKSTQVQLGEGFTASGIQPQPADIIAEGKFVLRLESDGRTRRDLAFRCALPHAEDLNKTPTVFFAFSAYDGSQDSQYFKNVSENMYFVEKPDPLLVSQSYLTIRLWSGREFCERTVQMTNYGYNIIYANFAGEKLLGAIDALEFIYYIDEDAPNWQGVCKLDTVFAGRTVDFTLKGSGMEQLFGVKNGSLKHENDLLTYRYSESSVLDFPDMTDAGDTVCDVFLPVKNTVTARVAALEDHVKLKLSFATDACPEFCEAHSKFFELSDARREQTVFWNLSDLELSGRLTKLRLEPAGSGTLLFKKFGFEQENVLEPDAGRFVSCTADADTITFVCRLKPEYVGNRLVLCETHPHLLKEDPADLERIAECPADEELVHLKAPLQGAKISRLSSQFIGFVIKPDDSFVKLAKRTVISNWRELCGGNPYDFTLPAQDYDVTQPPFNAKGDAFSNDTAAIQAAIDYAAANGGGRVVVPGSDEFYGRRYMVTNLRMKSNVELHLEEGAILWQADDLTYYDRMPRFGHNVAMTGVNWPANHTTGNFPLLFAFRQHNVKITGLGTIRMCDTESASVDGWFTRIGDNVCIGCTDRMHVVPLALTECENVEISSIHLIRSSAVHINLNYCRHAFIGGITIDQNKCTGADGIWPCGSDGVKITCILMNNNDDGICLSASYNDPRDVLWCYDYPGFDHGTHNVELSHSYLHCYTFTASAISFCTWGTDAPDLERHEVSDIHIFDTSLEGRASIGGWTDNPYYGVTPFDASEKDDFSPVKNVWVHNCDLQSPLSIAPLRITNFRNDFGFKSPSDFEYGSFRRRTAEQNEGWRAGLSNWSYTTREAVDQILLDGDTCACLRPMRERTCDLYQGLYLEAGTWCFHFEHKAAGTFTAFVRTADDQPVAAKEYSSPAGSYLKGRPWQPVDMAFTVSKPGLYHIGFDTDYEKTLVLYVTNCSLKETR